jgi:L-threonylcarbamoyladenylate synthase
MARPIHSSAGSIRPADPHSISEASALIAAGACIGVPTETVYGLAADATNSTAVADIFEIKGRPSFNPLIVHVASHEAAQKIALFDENADRLAAAFWPGALTLVLPLRQNAAIASLVTAGLETIAIRVPAHPIMRDLLEACGRPLAAPSVSVAKSARRAPNMLPGILAARSDLSLMAAPPHTGLNQP